jgi:hypothetical protein
MVRHWRDETYREYGLPTPVKPAGFRDRQRPPALLFLDLNHWILLARAEAGRGDPLYVELLAVLRKPLAGGRIKVVLTGALYREVSKIADTRHRNDLSALMQEISGPSYLPGPVDVLRAEIVAALDVTTGSSGTRFEPTDIVGGSALNIVGAIGGLGNLPPFNLDNWTKLETYDHVKLALETHADYLDGADFDEQMAHALAGRVTVPVLKGRRLSAGLVGASA